MIYLLARAAFSSASAMLIALSLNQGTAFATDRGQYPHDSPTSSHNQKSPVPQEKLSFYVKTLLGDTTFIEISINDETTVQAMHDAIYKKKGWSSELYELKLNCGEHTLNPRSYIRDEITK